MARKRVIRKTWVDDLSLPASIGIVLLSGTFVIDFVDALTGGRSVVAPRPGEQTMRQTYLMLRGIGQVPQPQQPKGKTPGWLDAVITGISSLFQMISSTRTAKSMEKTAQAQLEMTRITAQTAKETTTRITSTAVAIAVIIAIAIVLYALFKRR